MTRSSDRSELQADRRQGPRRPARFSALRVDVAAVRSELTDRAQGRRLELDGLRGARRRPAATERFAVQRTQLMEAKLAAAHPEIQTWSGTSLDNPGTTVALDVTPMGFHASVRGPNGQGAWYVDPAYNKRGTTEHLAYYGQQPAEKPSSPVERELPEMKRAVDQQRKASRSSTGRPGHPAHLPAGADQRPDVRRLLRQRERAGREGHPDPPRQPDLQRRRGDPDAPRQRHRRPELRHRWRRPPARTARAARMPATPWTRTPTTTSRASSPTATSAPCSATRPSSVS